MSWLSSGIKLVGKVLGGGNSQPTSFGGITPVGSGYQSAPTPASIGTAGQSGGGTDWGAILSGVAKLAPAVLAGYGLYSSAKQGAESDKLTDEALATARERDAQLKPLRDLGVSSALSAYQNPVTPYAAQGGYVDTGNSYTKLAQGAPIGTQGATPATPTIPAMAQLAALTGVTPLTRRTQRRSS